MAQTPSTMSLPLGADAPDFTLPDPSGKLFSLADFKGAPACLVMFLCNHCPFVVHIREELARLAKEYQKRGVAIVGINANDVARYPDDSPEKMAELSREVGFSFPYLYDETQATAKAYRAACTPDFFLFDRKLKLVYRGQFDDSRPGNGIPVTGLDLRAALDSVVAAKPVAGRQKPSIGCNIKWKVGKEPDYFK